MHASLPAPNSSGPALIGFSGGLDSTVLLHWLASFPAQRQHGLRAIHIHHGLQAQADHWATHCQAICEQLQVPLQVIRVQVAQDQGLGPEAAAREARHAAFAAALQPGERLATAHHQDDQAETFLLRALRASGPEGLAAMAPQRAFGNGQLWRPLLACSRQQLLDYARAHQLDWIEDPSNASHDYDRNFLRHAVMPLLRQRWPHAAASLARSAELSGEANRLLHSMDQDALQPLLDEQQSLDLSQLRKHPPARQARLLRLWVSQQQAPALPAQGVRVLLAELQQSDSNRETCFAWQNVQIRRWRQRLYLLPPQPHWPRAWQVQWDGSAPLVLPDGGQLQLLRQTQVANTNGADADADAQRSQPLNFPTPLRVCPRHGGERMTLPGRLHSHQLKHLLQQSNLPPWLRLRLPLLFDGPLLLAAGDLLISARLQSWLQQHQARLQWQPGPII